MKKRFVLIYFVSILFFAIPIILNLIVLKNAGELDSVESIVHKQITDNMLYGSATNQNTFFYKLELIKATKPDIVAIGSSRVMQFRKEMFNTSFSNAGGAVNSVAEAEKFVNEMLKLHKPKIVIFGLDDWWFNPNSPAANWKNPENDTSTLITFEKVIAPYSWLYKGKITFHDYSLLLSSDDKIKQSIITRNNLLGISSIKRTTGFRPDGSYFYGNIITTANKEDYLFKDTLRRIDHGADRLEYSNNISEKHWIKAMTIISKLRASGVIVISFIPPYSNTVYKKINETAQYSYMSELSKKAKKEKISDFRNPNILNLTDCDFIDGMHASEIAYLKLLLNLKEIRHFIHPSYTSKKYIHSVECFLNMPIDFTLKYKETDLLGIGCNRNTEACHVTY